MQDYLNVYQSIHGIKLRWVDFDRLTLEEVEAMTAAIYDESPTGSGD